jgi:hypothetical protein
MSKVRLVFPKTQIPEVCELPTEFQPAHELPPLMSMIWAEAIDTPKVPQTKILAMIEIYLVNMIVSPLQICLEKIWLTVRILQGNCHFCNGTVQKQAKVPASPKCFINNFKCRHLGKAEALKKDSLHLI